MKLGRELVVTLKLDDLRVNGLSKLLERSKEDGIPKTPNLKSDAVCNWWRSQTEFSARQAS